MVYAFSVIERLFRYAISRHYAVASFRLRHFDAFFFAHLMSFSTDIDTPRLVMFFAITPPYLCCCCQMPRHDIYAAAYLITLFAYFL